MRVSDYLFISFKDILRQPVRSGLTVIALAISTVILVTLLSISFGAKHAIIDGLGLNKSLSNIVVTPNQSVGTSFLSGNVQLANESAAKLDDSTVARLQQIPHVQIADPRVNIWEFKTFTVEGSSKDFVAQAMGMTTTNPQLITVKAGTTFNGAEDKNEVVLGYAYAKELGYGANPAALVGKTVTVTTHEGYRGKGATIPLPRAPRAEQESFARTPTKLTATIVGISAEGTSENQLLLPMGWAREIKTAQNYNSRGAIVGTDVIDKNGYDTISMEADDAKNVAAITAELTKRGYGVVSTQQQIERINSLTTILWGVLGSIALVSLITACLGIVNTMLMTISEQRYSIGVWRACGARKRTIALRFIVQSTILGFIGGVIGAGIGWVIARYASHYIIQLLKTEKLPAVDVVQVSPTLLILCIGVTILFGMVSGLYPAWRATKEDPSRALTSQ